MKLRLRLAVTAVVATIPAMLALIAFDAVAQHRAAERILIESVYGRTSMERASCESSPESWGGEQRPENRAPWPHAPPPRGERPPGPPRGERPPGPPRDFNDGPGGPSRDDPTRRHAMPPVVFAYDERFLSRNPRAPALTEAMKEAIQGQDAAIAPLSWSSASVEVLVRMPWGSGPCAFVHARGTTDPSWGAILPENHFWLLPTFAVFAAVLLAMGPVIQRIRQLTEAVRRSASAAYASDIVMRGKDEIGELARAFNAAGGEIRAQLAEKDQRERALRDFLANTTHDVMIPLTVLQGHLASLREGAAEGKPVDVGVLVSAMDEAHYMASLVHNLAVVARLEAAEVKLQPSTVDLNALVLRVTGRHRPIARQLDIALESAVPEEPVRIRADVTLIEQAVSNVTYNAIRYNRSGGHVAVILEPGAEGRFSLRVIDDGPGIAPEELSRLAERGFRGNDARTRAPEGQGLGLHIAHRAAELHGYRLTLRPSTYGGLEVELEGERAHVTRPDA